MPIEQIRDYTQDLDNVDTYAISRLSNEEKEEIARYIEIAKNKIREIEELL